jgi:hypothetical protein
LEKQEIDVSGYEIEIGIEIRKYTENDQQKILNFYCAYWSNSDFTVQKTKKDLKTVLKDHLLGGGQIFLAFIDNQLQGICFAIEQGGCLVKELLSQGEIVCSNLLKVTAQHYGCDVITLFDKPKVDFVPIETSSIEFSGMARIIRLFDVLSLFAKANPNVCVRLNVQDDIIAVNSGVYEIKNGICLKTCVKPQTDTVWNMEQVLLWILGKTHGIDNNEQLRHRMYMNLMLN